MSTTIAVPLSVDGIQRAIDQLENWALGTLEPAADHFVMFAAEAAKDIMYSDAHGPFENEANTGGLKEQIKNADIDLVGRGAAQITVHEGPGRGKWRKTNPRKEMEWGNRMHGNTEPPHDFTRNIEDVADMAQSIWNSEIKDLL